MKFTKHQLENAVLESVSITEVMRFLGYTVFSGERAANINRRIRRLGIDNSHFIRHRPRARDKRNRLTPGEILIKNRRRGGRREDSGILRRAMLRKGIKEVCSACKLGTDWQGKVLRMQIHHKNGDAFDNRQDNLVFLCPNCHAQETARNVKNNNKQKTIPCFECGKSFSMYVNRSRKYCCVACFEKSRRKLYINKSTLEKLVWEKPFVKIGEDYGVSDTVVKNLCVRFKIICPPKNYWKDPIRREKVGLPALKYKKKGFLKFKIDKNILASLVQDVPIREIAKQYNVSRSCVETRCRQYGIKLMGKNYWANERRIRQR